MYYRIFDEEKNKYLQGYEGYTEKDGTIIDKRSNGTNYVEKFLKTEQGVELFNEDGKQQVLYEGDIVKCEALDLSHALFENLIGEVIFLEGQFWIKFKDEMFKLWNEYLSYTVIGNIHSDSEMISEYYESEDIYESFIEKMLNTPNERFEIRNSSNNGLTTWVLEIDERVFKIYKDNIDEAISLWFMVEGTPKEVIFKKEDHSFFDRWQTKYEQYLKEKEEDYEKKAILKLTHYKNQIW